MTVSGHAPTTVRHIHVYDPDMGVQIVSITADLPSSTIRSSLTDPYEVYTGDRLEFATARASIPAGVMGAEMAYGEIAMPIDGLYAGVDPDSGLGIDISPAFGLLGAGVALSSIWYLIPDAQKRVVLTTLAGLGAVRGAPFAKSALLAGLRSAGPVGIAAATLMATLVAADTFTVDLDIPFVPSVPLPGGNGQYTVPSTIVGAIDFAVAQHGPVVKSWVANGTPFYLFMDGWQAAQKRNGSWKFWKPKKPVVYVPGGPMSKKNARRLASIYNAEKKRAKKEFNLVDSRQGQGTRNGQKPTVIVETGPGGINTR